LAITNPSCSTVSLR